MLNVFICSKPLQYFNCLNIVSSLNNSKNILFCLPNFYKSEEFYLRIDKNDTHWDEVIQIKSRTEIVKYLDKACKFNLFTDNDLYTALKPFKFFINLNNIYVYEEGLSVYNGVVKVTNVNRYYLVLNFLAKIGVLNSIMGAHKKTNKIYTYYIDNYKKINGARGGDPTAFPRKFVDNYLAEQEIIEKVFDINKYQFPMNKKICLFLTSNDLAYDFVKDYKQIVNAKKFDSYIFKSHPLVAEKYIGIDSSGYDLIMAEILLLKLLSNGNQVNVYHYGTSAELYIVNDDVIFENIS